MNAAQLKSLADAHRESPKVGDPDIYSALIGEEARQADVIELIPSETYTYPEVLAVLGSVFKGNHRGDHPAQEQGGRAGAERLRGPPGAGYQCMKIDEVGWSLKSIRAYNIVGWLDLLTEFLA